MARRLDYFLRETAIGLRRNAVVTFAAVSTVFISLFLLGGAFIINKQTDVWLDEAYARVEVTVFLTDEISPAQKERLGDKLNDMPEVDTVTYESKAEAYNRFKVLFASQPDLVENVSAEALPASFRVKLLDPEKFEVVAARLAGEPGIDKVRDQRQFLNRLFAIANTFRWALVSVAVIMLISAVGLIANTVRMALFARRKEIGIMKLVGATNWYIRVPFLVEGVIQGLVGAAAALGALFLIRFTFVNKLGDSFQALPPLATSQMVFVIPLLLIGGIAVAALASLLAMRRFLDV